MIYDLPTVLISDIYHKHPKTIGPDTTIARAVKLMIDLDVNGFVVISKGDRVVGVLSIQDIAAATIPRQFRENLGMAAGMYRKGFFHEMSQEIRSQPVKTVMRRNFVKVNLHTNIMAVTADFLKNDLYIVPVVEKGKLVGIVTRTEIKHALATAMGIEQKKVDDSV